MYSKDQRIVATLDAGGTNLVFGAMRANQFIIEPLTIPSQAHDLDLCLQEMVRGFQYVFDQLEEKPVAISFAFPGPADYPNGIIGGYLPNFPSFRDGVALGPFLSKKFGVPVYINNDGDLFTYGEALCGVLPEINQRLKEVDSPKQFKNLVGYTLGTGLGVGIVVNNQLNQGDNSCVETFCLAHPTLPNIIIEEGASIRAVCRVYGEEIGQPDHGLTPKDICMIADGVKEGNQAAAQKAFGCMGEVVGHAISTALTLVDGIVVIGGGVIGAKKWIMPSLLGVLRGQLQTLSGDAVNRIQPKVYDLDDAADFEKFVQGKVEQIKVYGTDNEYVAYDCEKRTGVIISRMGASQAISVGAYAYALSELDKVNAASK
ncbi:MAG: ROK family protein [Bacteroidaceae bacterium]|nr:ROK family protein [Bacteroidaceae bacterium]